MPVVILNQIKAWWDFYSDGYQFSDRQVWIY